MKTIKGNEVINHITDDIRIEMPDFEQVRDNCLNQENVGLSKKNNVKKGSPVYVMTRILATAAILVFIVGLFNIQIVIAAVGGFVEEAIIKVEETFSKTEYYITVNTSPGNDDKFQGGGTNMVYNLNTHQKENVIIQVRKKGDKNYIIEIATNAVVKLDKKNNIVIGGDTIIDRDGNIIEYGTASCNLKKSDGTFIEINPLLPHQNESMNEEARIEYAKSGISKDLIQMLAYVSNDLIDEIAKTEYEKSGLKMFPETMAAYVSQKVLDEIVAADYEINGIKFVSDNIFILLSPEVMDEIYLKEYETNGFLNLDYLMSSYISESLFDQIVIDEYEKNGFKNISVTLYSLINKKTLDNLVTEDYDSYGFENFSIHVYPYISEDTLDDFAIAEYEKSGFENFSIHIYHYLSENTIDNLVTTEYGKNGFENFSPNIYFYINDNTLDKLAITEYEKNGLDSLEKFAQYLSKDCLGEIKQKEYEKTGKYPLINDDIGRRYSIPGDGLSIREAPFIGEIRYITVEHHNDEIIKEITKIGKDGEYAEIYIENKWEPNNNTNVTITDGEKIVVVNKKSDGVVFVSVEQNGDIEITEIDPQMNPNMIIELNGKTVEISQNTKNGVAYVKVTKGDVTARIKIAKNAEINVYDYLLTDPLYDN